MENSLIKDFLDEHGIRWTYSTWWLNDDNKKIIDFVKVYKRDANGEFILDEGMVRIPHYHYDNKGEQKQLTINSSNLDTIQPCHLIHDDKNRDLKRNNNLCIFHTNNHFPVLDIDDEKLLDNELVKELLENRPYYLSASKKLPHIFLINDNYKSQNMYLNDDHFGELLSTGKMSIAPAYGEILNAEKMNETEYLPRQNEILKKFSRSLHQKKEPLRRENEPMNDDDNDENDDELHPTLQKLFTCIRPDRGNNYEGWTTILRALKNSGFSFHQFHILSRDYFDNYVDEESCLSKWNDFPKMINGGYTIGTLHKWAMEDDTEKYFSYEEFRLERELVENFNSYNIARYVYCFYKKNIYYSSRAKKWYELDDDNKWCERDEPILLHHQCYNILIPPLQRKKDKLWEKYTKLTEQGKEKESKECLKEWKETKKKMEKAGDFTTRNNIVKDMKKLTLNEKITDLFNSKNNLLAFDNGVYDLDTMEFRKIRPDDFITLTTGYDYVEEFDEDTREKVFETIEEMFYSTEDMEYMLKVFASCLYGGNFNQEFYCLNGVGGNGKSVLSEAIKAVFGEYSIDIDIINFTKKQGNGTSDFPKGRYKRVLFSSESELGDKLQVGTIKNITGDETIRCRELHEKYISYVPQFKPFLLTNEKPEFNDDGGMKRRMRLVDFPYRFLNECDVEYDTTNPLIKKRNDELGNLLKKSKIELLHILLEYYTEMKESGTRKIELTENLKMKTNDYCNEQNKLKVFIDENYVYDEKMAKKDIYNASTLYNDYRYELESKNERNIISKKVFLLEMKKLGYEGLRDGNIFCGYKLKKILNDDEF